MCITIMYPTDIIHIVMAAESPHEPVEMHAEPSQGELFDVADFSDAPKTPRVGDFDPVEGRPLYTDDDVRIFNSRNHATNGEKPTDEQTELGLSAVRSLREVIAAGDTASLQPRNRARGSSAPIVRASDPHLKSRVEKGSYVPMARQQKPHVVERAQLESSRNPLWGGTEAAHKARLARYSEVTATLRQREEQREAQEKEPVDSTA